MKRIILDTDIGDDIDDALALALVLESPEIELIGITTVFKYAELRSRLTRYILQQYSRLEIPIYTGLSKPIKTNVEVESTILPAQFDVLDYKIREEQEKNQDAVDFITTTVKNDPDVYIVAIGPLTNIAAAVINEPEIMKNAKLVMMGGMITTAYPEWNIVCDPEAAHVVFESGMDITMIGLDVTLKSRLKERELQSIHQCVKDDSKCLSSLTKKWMSESKHNPILHDPLAIGYLISDKLFKFKHSDIRVETQGEFTRGVTVDYGDVFGHRNLERINAKVAIDVDRDQFVTMFLQRVFGER